MNKDDFIKKVMQQLNIQDKGVAERGVQIVLSILSHRLTVEEASDVADQLPHDLKRVWNNQIWITNYFFLSGKRLKYRHKVELMSLVENEILREGLPLHAESLTKAVLHTLKDQITPGEAEDISAQLPEELRDFFKAA
ncbi:MAG: hypothetical protein A2104_09630 [Candidatus Melainabacteria bacterium GWF2_32_7]|nr:MAG: hypothetical protein A2104_09630 [Candidatus Melainabacteria bacterium GWF2_32_7]